MGYDLHITRREDWTDSGSDITIDEWLSYVARDPLLELDLTGDNGPYFVLVKGTSPDPDLDDWLNWHDGKLYSKSPRKKLVERMIKIAEDFEAKVQGQDGELYLDSSEVPD
jgi:hypothetical protein